MPTWLLVVVRLWLRLRGCRYEDYEHIGYDVDGQKIGKRAAQSGLERAIAARDDPNHRRTVYDSLNDREVCRLLLLLLLLLLLFFFFFFSYFFLIPPRRAA